MKCEDIEHLMIDYLDNTLDEETRVLVDSHLASCEKCPGLFKESRKLLNLISDSGMEQPDDSLRANFYKTLHNEIKNTDRIIQVPSIPSSARSINLFMRIAAGLALLITGFFAGNMVKFNGTPGNPDERIEQLQSEVTEMRKQMMFTMLNESSSSYRLKAIGYTDELNNADDEVVKALLNTLNNDDNVNVRIAAAFSLERFTDNRMVCDSLIASLPRQADPVVQVTLINILVDIREKSVLRILYQIISDENTLTEVRSVAEAGAKELML